MSDTISALLNLAVRARDAVHDLAMRHALLRVSIANTSRRGFRTGRPTR